MEPEKITFATTAAEWLHHRAIAWSILQRHGITRTAQITAIHETRTPEGHSAEIVAEMADGVRVTIHLPADKLIEG